MEAIAQVLCSLNGNKGGTLKPRHLIVVAFDHENHGSRLKDKTLNFSWKKDSKRHNPNHAMDQWRMMQAAAQTVTGLMDVLESHLFDAPVVDIWGVLGFSMGAHSSYLVAASGKTPLFFSFAVTHSPLDPRISVHISLVGTGDFIGLLLARLANGGFPSEYLPDAFCDRVLATYDGLADKLAMKKVLMINGGEDAMVPFHFNDGLVNAFLASHDGSRGRDWDRVVVSGLGHAWCPEMFYLCSAWCKQWMLDSDPDFSLVLPPSCSSP